MKIFKGDAAIYIYLALAAAIASVLIRLWIQNAPDVAAKVGLPTILSGKAA